MATPLLWGDATPRVVPPSNPGMGEVVSFKTRTRRRGEKRTLRRDDYVRGQQVLANAIFHWKNDAEPDARAAVRFLMHHLATAFRADDTPLQPRPVGSGTEAAADDQKGTASGTPPGS